MINNQNVVAKCQWQSRRCNLHLPSTSRVVEAVVDWYNGLENDGVGTFTVYVPISLYIALLLIEITPGPIFSVQPDGNAWPSFIHVSDCGAGPLYWTSICTCVPCFTLAFVFDVRIVASEYKKTTLLTFPMTVDITEQRTEINELNRHFCYIRRQSILSPDEAKYETSSSFWSLYVSTCSTYCTGSKQLLRSHATHVFNPLPSIQLKINHTRSMKNKRCSRQNYYAAPPQFCVTMLLVFLRMRPQL